MTRDVERQSSDGRALLVDYAGVLTPGVAESWRAFEQEHGMPARTIATMLWAAYEPDDADDEHDPGDEDGTDGANPIAMLERGELEVGDFEQRFAGQLRDAGYDVVADGLVAALFADLRPSGGVWDLVRDVRAKGVPAVLVSNSWGMSGYPRALLDTTFDELVFSGEVGMRKPDREIFQHAADQVGAELPYCVFIDDAPANVEAAQRYGMTAVLHKGDDEATRDAVLSGLGL